MTEHVRSRDVYVIADDAVAMELCCGGGLREMRSDVGGVCVGEVGLVVLLLHIFLRFLFVVVPGVAEVGSGASADSASLGLVSSTSRRASVSLSCSSCCSSSRTRSSSAIASSLSRQVSASSFSSGV